MAFAVFSDIHGNLEALEAILKHIKKNRNIKQIFYLGDAITFGPDSSKCLKLLKKHDVQCVLGNHEQRIVRYDRSVKSMTYASAEHMKFIFLHLDTEDLRYIKTMPVEMKINYKGCNILFTHYSHDENGVIRDDYDDFTESRFEKMFEEKKCDVVFFGHIHKRKIIIDENYKSYVCAGSSGCVKGERTFYTYFDINERLNEVKNYDVYRIDLPFNRKKFEEKMIASKLPGKEKYAEYTFGIKFETKVMA